MKFEIFVITSLQTTVNNNHYDKWSYTFQNYQLHCFDVFTLLPMYLSQLMPDYGQVSSAFGGEAIIRGKCLLEGEDYFDLTVKWCGPYFRPGAYKRKYGKTEDAQYS